MAVLENIRTLSSSNFKIVPSGFIVGFWSGEAFNRDSASAPASALSPSASESSAEPGAAAEDIGSGVATFSFSLPSLFAASSFSLYLLIKFKLEEGKEDVRRGK